MNIYEMAELKYQEIQDEISIAIQNAFDETYKIELSKCKNCVDSGCCNPMNCQGF